MKIDKETQNRIQELQFSEQGMQNLLLQKQAFQMEMNETDAALDELNKSKDEVYKIVGQVMLKSEKEDMKKELADKKKILELRLKAIEKQETIVKEKIEDLHKGIEEELKKAK